MVNTVSFIRANLQHNIAASRNLSRTVSAKGIDMALIQEPWFREGHIRGLNIPGYTLYSSSGTDRPRVWRKATACMLPGFSCRDLVAVLIKYNEEEAERGLVVRSAYLPYDSVDSPPSKEFEENLRYCENENLYLVVRCDSNAHYTVWGSTNCNTIGEALVDFLILQIWRF